jgi:hypothetical protein
MMIYMFLNSKLASIKTKSGVKKIIDYYEMKLKNESRENYMTDMVVKVTFYFFYFQSLLFFFKFLINSI